MTEGIIRFRLFLVSYFPLWAMLTFRAIPSGKWVWDGRTRLVVFFGIIAAGSLFEAFHIIRSAKRTSTLHLFFGDIKDQGSNAAGYLATYLLPFVGVAPTNWRDWVIYGIYFVAAAIVFIRTDLTFINPTLYLLNYCVVSANAYTSEDRDPMHLTSYSPVIVVCRSPKKILKGRIDVVTLSGGLITVEENTKKDQIENPSPVLPVEEN